MVCAIDCGQYVNPGIIAAQTEGGAIFGASAADVRAVVAGGREIVRDGRHLLVPDVPAALSAAIRAVQV